MIEAAVNEPAGDTATEALAASIARHVAERRRAKGLSLDALARRAGVSKGILVAIEAGRGNPSIGTLCRVANGLGVTVADLVGKSERDTVVITQASDVPVLWHGDFGGSGKLLAGASDPMTLEMWSWEIRPGERHRSDGHPPGAREILHVMRGELALVVDGTTHLVGAGSSVSFLADRVHEYANQGEETLKMMMTVAELAPVSQHGTRSMQQA
jgi:transcriptional regulator with XRE-family HTH domain